MLRAVNSAGECYLHTVEVTGSNPVPPTNKTKGLGDLSFSPEPLFLGIFCIPKLLPWPDHNAVGGGESEAENGVDGIADSLEDHVASFC